MRIHEILNNLGHYLTVLVVSMAPVIELKGAMPIGLAAGLGVWETFSVALLGSCMPAPILMLVIKRFLNWADTCKIGFLQKFAQFLHKKIEKGRSSKAFETSALLGLFIFVAIPLPTTGVWTGSMIAGTLDLPMKKALPVIILGNTIAGLIILGMSHLLILS